LQGGAGDNRTSTSPLGSAVCQFFQRFSQPLGFAGLSEERGGVSNQQRAKVRIITRWQVQQPL
jgi:hypothetical protein